MTQFMRVETTGGNKMLINIDRIERIDPASTPGEVHIYLVGWSDIQRIKGDFNQFVRDLPCIKF